MDLQTTEQKAEFNVGDTVMVSETKFSGAEQKSGATIVEIRYILGKLTYVIETAEGKRKVIGASQVSAPKE